MQDTASGMDQGGQHWHLDKRLNVGHLFTTVALTAGLFVWAGKMDTRLALLEASIQQQHRVDASQDEQTKMLQQELARQLAAVNTKLDRLIERQLDRK